MSERIIPQLSTGVTQRLRMWRRKTSDMALRNRIQMVLLYNEGRSSTQIGKDLGYAPSAVGNILRRFRDSGFEGLEDGRKYNGQSKIDADLLQALAEILTKSPQDYGWSRPTWSRELLVKTLREETGVSVSVRTMDRMLTKLKARHGIPRPLSPCPWSKQKKTRRMREIRRIVENLPEEEIAFYEDEVDIHLNPKIGRDWMLEGVQKTVMTPGKNQKRYLAGALSVDGSELIVVENASKNSHLFIALLERLREKHPEARRIHLVLDNCRVHDSQAVRKYLLEQKDLFVFHFLPPYSPEHNKIERLWRDLHANVTRNHRCRTMKQLMKEVKDWLRAEASKRKRRKPLDLPYGRRRMAA